MADKRRPTANEYKLLERVVAGWDCYRTTCGAWKVAPALVSEGSPHSVSTRIVQALVECSWGRRRYLRRWHFYITDAGHKAYEDESRRRLESKT